MDNVYLIIASTGASLIFSLLLIPLILKLAHRFHWYDDIDHRKVHTEDTPHIGGIGIFLASSAGIILFYILNTFIFKQDIVPFTSLLPIFIAYMAIHITGVIDDFTNMHARYKFVIQIAAAAVIAIMGYAIKAVELPWFEVTIPFGPAAYFITILWLAGASNAINFIDGIDGLAGGISAIAALSFGIVFAITGAYTSALVAFAFLGALLGFLVFNWPPGKIFMGDCGAIFLGFALGALPLLEHSGTTSLISVMIPFSLLLFPLLDMLAAILRRIRRRISIGAPDKEHTHHKLLDFGFKERGILAILYGLSALPCAAVIVWAATGIDGFFWLVIATWVIMIVFFIMLDVKYHRKERELRSPASAGPQPE